MSIRLNFPSVSHRVRVWDSARRAMEANSDVEIIRPPNYADDGLALELSSVDRVERSVLLISDGVGYEFSVWSSLWDGALWIAHGSRLYKVPNRPSLTEWIDFDSPIVDFRVIEQGGERLIIVCEASVSAVDSGREVLWAVGTDLVEEVSWQPSSVVLTQMDGPALVVVYQDGSTTEAGSPLTS